MNREAIFSDGTKEFRCPTEPKSGDRVSICIRLAHGDNASVSLLTHFDCIQMKRDREDETFDYYRTDIRLSNQNFVYCFQIEAEGEKIYYDRYSVTDELRWQYAFSIVPDFETPDWSKGAVMYQILVDRFFNGDTSNDVCDHEYAYIDSHVQHIQDWNQKPSTFDVGNFYGGDLEGVRQKLYYLKSLGVEVIYFNPLFVSPSNHKYDIEDYDSIDPHYGKIVADGGTVLPDNDFDNTHATKYIQRVTDKKNLEASNQFFAAFVREAHEKGIRVILDGVFNHCGSFNKWLDRERIYENADSFEKGAYVSADSPYRNFFEFRKEGHWPYNAAYNGWWGHDTLPKLNYENSRELCHYILEIGKKWVSPPYNADGWRLDVAADLGHSEAYNHTFWKKFRAAVKTANPDAVILAEHYGDATPWLGGDQWDTIMNYDAFMEPVSFFLTGMEKHSDRFDEQAIHNGRQFEMTMRHTMTEFLTPSLLSAMNQLSNHDHSRFLTRTNHKAGRLAELGSEAAEEGVNFSVMKEAMMMQMTWPGAPTIYYGDEAGVCGFTDPDNRRTYPWGNANYPLIDFTRDMIMLHKVNPALIRGSFNFLSCGQNYVSYGRFSSEQQLAVIINSSDTTFEVDIPVWKAGMPKNGMAEQIMMTNVKGYSILPVKTPIADGNVHIKLEAYMGIVLRHNA